MKIIAFGEVMLRLSPPGYLRFAQAPILERTFGGAELNVAVSLAQFGLDSGFVTVLPENTVADACVAEIKGLGVDTSAIVRGGDRMGVYYVETGAAQRASTVLYDRRHSAIAGADPGVYDWNTMLCGATALHVTGITPALSESCRVAMTDAMTTAKRLGVRVFFDLNYRSTLWSAEDAGRTLAELLPLAGVGFVSDYDAGTLFDITSQETDPDAKQADVAAQLIERFGLEAVAMSRREQHSASRNGWSGLFYTDGTAHTSRRYEIDHIVDRVGGGDAFAAGIIYGVLTGKPAQEAVEFAAAASCLKHSIAGDFNRVTVAEVEDLVSGDGSGRVQR